MASTCLSISEQEYLLERIGLPIHGKPVPVDEANLEPGDHIAIRRLSAKLCIRYYHHGIYMGRNDDVVEFGVNKKAKYTPKIQRVGLEQFMHGHPLLRVEYPSGSCLGREKTIAKAMEYLDNPEIFGPYSAIRNNCEHFAMLCKTGMHVSRGVVKTYKYFPLKWWKLKLIETIIISGGLHRLERMLWWCDITRVVSLYHLSLSMYHMAKFGLSQMKRNCKRQSKLGQNLKVFLGKGRTHCEEKEKLLSLSNFSFYHYDNNP